MTSPWHHFLLIGLLVAGLEEFITQGVLKHDFGGWMMRTLIAFIPFLMTVWAIDRVFRVRLEEPRAALMYYVVAGTLGLLFEWFAMGLSPWRNPNLLQLPFQVGMFSFWGTVALAPRILLDRRERLFRLRKAYLRYLVLGFLLIYGITFAVPRETRFGAVLGAVLLFFILLNGFYIAYLKALSRQDAP